MKPHVYLGPGSYFCLGLKAKNSNLCHKTEISNRFVPQCTRNKKKKDMEKRSALELLSGWSGFTRKYNHAIKIIQCIPLYSIRINKEFRYLLILNEHRVNIRVAKHYLFCTKLPKSGSWSCVLGAPNN